MNSEGNIWIRLCVVFSCNLKPVVKPHIIQYLEGNPHKSTLPSTSDFRNTNMVNMFYPLYINTRNLFTATIGVNSNDL